MDEITVTLTKDEAEALLRLLEPWAEEADYGGDGTGAAIDRKLRAAMGKPMPEEEK